MASRSQALNMLELIKKSSANAQAEESIVKLADAVADYVKSIDTATPPWTRLLMASLDTICLTVLFALYISKEHVHVRSYKAALNWAEQVFTEIRAMRFKG